MCSLLTMPAYKRVQFFLFYGHDPQLPTDAALCATDQREYADVDDYKSEVTMALTAVWELAREHVKKAQKVQKKHYN